MKFVNEIFKKIYQIVVVVVEYIFRCGLYNKIDDLPQFT